MDARAVSPTLADRLGPGATAGLVELIDAVEETCVETVLERSVERFERRLTEEVSKLRVEIIQLQAAMRQEMAALGSSLRQEITGQKFDLLKWSFLFWIGQVVAMAGIVSLLLRTARP